jgi:hypothetical protein
LKISFCVSDGRSRIVTFFAGAAVGGAAIASAASVSMAVGDEFES